VIFFYRVFDFTGRDDNYRKFRYRKESATIALEYIKANAKLMGLNPEIISNYNIHLHVPEGATPKDGPVLV
jgi:ATP-dependent Lon protease